jgi:hypothetical protein
MAGQIRVRSKVVGLVFALVTAVAVPASADEIWVAPTSQQDLGGLGIATSTVWPVTPVGGVRLAWGVPNNLQTFQRARVVLIPQAPGGAATLNVLVCAAQDGNMAGANCAGPFAQTFTGVANQLTEVEIGPMISSRIGVAGANYLAVLAYTTPTTTTDHILGLRFSFVPKVANGVATLGANTFTGTQTATAFVGNGSGLTGLPPGPAGPTGPTGPTGPAGPAGPAGSGNTIVTVEMGGTTDILTTCTNYGGGTITVNAVAGHPVEVVGTVHLRFNHNVATSDTGFVVVGATPTDCFAANFKSQFTVGVGVSTAPFYSMTLPFRRVFVPAVSGPVTYYLNAQMINGQNAGDQFYFGNMSAHVY